MSDPTSLQPRPKGINAEFFTGTFRLTGNITTAASGLFGLLNDKDREYIVIEGVYLSYVVSPSAIIKQVPQAHVAKSGLELVVLSKLVLAGPESTLRGGFARVVQHKVMVTTRHYQVQGLVNAPGQLEMGVLLNENASTFLLLMSATAYAYALPKATYSGEALLINRQCVDFIAEA